MAGGRGGLAVAAALWARGFTAEARRLNENRPPKSRTGAGEGAERRLQQLADRPLRQRGHDRDAHRSARGRRRDGGSRATRGRSPSEAAMVAATLRWCEAAASVAATWRSSRP